MTTQAINSDTADIPSVNFSQQSGDVAAPAAGRWQLFFKAGGLYARSNAGGVIGPFVTDLSGAVDADAIHVDEADEIAGLTEKATPVNADLLVIEDSAAAGVKKKVQVGNLPNASAASAGEGHVTLLGMMWASYSGSSNPRWTTSGVSALSGYMDFTTPADLAYVNYETYLAAGTYSLRLVYNTSNGLGILDVDVGGTEVLSQDLYTSGATQKNLATATGIVIAAAGLTQIRLRVHGKNGSSGGYNIQVSCLSLWRTA